MKLSSVIAGFFYGLMSMVLMPLVLVLLSNFLQLPRLDNAYVQILGAFSVIFGGVLLVYSTRLFATYGNGGSPLPFDPPIKLVTVGVYKYIRNPMFTASALIWFGEYFFFGSLLLLIYAIGWVTVNHTHLIMQDEKWLEKRFGKEYLNYKKNTPRYIPRFIK